MDDLLKIDVAIPYIADVLTEVFTGGPELCLKVREEQVGKLFQMVASLGEKKGRPELIMTLQAISKVTIVLEKFFISAYFLPIAHTNHYYLFSGRT